MPLFNHCADNIRNFFHFIKIFSDFQIHCSYMFFIILPITHLFSTFLPFQSSRSIMAFFIS